MGRPKRSFSQDDDQTELAPVVFPVALEIDARMSHIHP